MNKIHVGAPASHGRYGRSKRIALLTSLALVSLSASLTFAAPASAAVITGVVKVELESADNSNTAKSVTVECPDGKKVINAGGYITDGGGSVAMDDIFPNEALTSVTVTGKETDTYATSWRVRAFATCAVEPPGLEWIWAPSGDADVPDDFKRAEAECTDGKTLLSTGTTILGGNGEVAIDMIAPNGDRGVAADKVTVDAFTLDPLNGAWEVNAFAICADPLDGQEVFEESTPQNQSENDGLRVDCRSDQVATGSGAQIIGAFGEVVIDDAYPTDGSPNTPPTATTVYAQEEDGTTNVWQIEGYVLCADASR